MRKRNIQPYWLHAQSITHIYWSRPFLRAVIDRRSIEVYKQAEKGLGQDPAVFTSSVPNTWTAPLCSSHSRTTRQALLLIADGLFCFKPHYRVTVTGSGYPIITQNLGKQDSDHSLSGSCYRKQTRFVTAPKFVKANLAVVEFGWETKSRTWYRRNFGQIWAPWIPYCVLLLLFGAVPGFVCVAKGTSAGLGCPWV